VREACEVTDPPSSLSHGRSPGRSKLPGGIGVALVTIFKGDGTLDVATTTQCARHCVDHGIRFILVAGTTGEAWRLSAADRVELVGAIKESLPHIPVLVGTGDPRASTALELTEHLSSRRVADGLVVLSPSDMGAAEFYTAVREVAPEDTVLAYSFPDAFPPGIHPSELPLLPVDGIKDSSGSADRLAEMVSAGFEVYVGSSNLLAIAGPCGAKGAILALANIVPELCWEAWAGDTSAQRELFGVHVESLSDFPNGVKAEVLKALESKTL